MSDRWKDLERTAARKLGGRRFPRWRDLFEKAVDVVVPDFPDLRIDCKSRARFSHHRFLREIDTKYCNANQSPVLITKGHGETGEVVSMPLDTLAGLLNELRTLRRRAGRCG